MAQNYKETLNLPRTDFPMKANLASREPDVLRMWEETRLYEQIQKAREGAELFVLHDDLRAIFKFPIATGKLAGKTSIRVRHSTPGLAASGKSISNGPALPCVFRETTPLTVRFYCPEYLRQRPSYCWLRCSQPRHCSCRLSPF